MKKFLFSAGILAVTSFGMVNAQSNENLGDLKAKKEVLKLNTKLNDYKIKLEKERKDCNKVQSDVKSANRSADRKGSNFSGSDNASATAKEAKAAAKRMKDAQKANEKLAKCQKNIQSYEKDIKKTEDKIEKLNQQIQFTDGKNDDTK